MIKTKALSIIIVNWNSGQQILDCIKSVFQHGETLVNEIIVVDNGSTNGSEIALQDISGVTLIKAGENLGFVRSL